MTCARVNVSLVRAYAGVDTPVLLALGGFNGKVFMNTIETFVCGK
jgi:fructose-1-phosphate kinase PfkB-like protein